MDEKTLQAICAQLTELQLQMEALRQLVLHHSPPDAKDQYRRLLDELYKDAPDFRESIRNGIRQGVVIQQFHDIGQGHLWTPQDPPDDPGEPQSKI